MAINGNDIIIKKDGVAIAACRSCKVSPSCDTIEKSSPLQGQWREFMAGRKEWSVQCSYLIPAVSNINDVLLVGSVVTIVLTDRTGTNTLTGTAICVQAEGEYTRMNLAQGAYVFKGTGPLT